MLSDYHSKVWHVYHLVVTVKQRQWTLQGVLLWLLHVTQVLAAWWLWEVRHEILPSWNLPVLHTESMIQHHTPSYLHQQTHISTVHTMDIIEYLCVITVFAASSRSVAIWYHLLLKSSSSGSSQLTCFLHSSCINNLAWIVMGDSQLRGLYSLKDACKVLHLVTGEVVWCLIWQCIRESVSVHVFHFNPSRLTVVLECSVLSLCAFCCSLGLFDAQDQRLNFASLMIVLDSV